MPGGCCSKTCFSSNVQCMPTHNCLLCILTNRRKVHFLFDVYVCQCIQRIHDTQGSHGSHGTHGCPWHPWGLTKGGGELELLSACGPVPHAPLRVAPSLEAFFGRPQVFLLQVFPGPSLQLPMKLHHSIRLSKLSCCAISMQVPRIPHLLEHEGKRGWRPLRLHRCCPALPS